MTTDCSITIRSATPGDAAAISRLMTGSSREFITPEYTPKGTANLLSHQSPDSIRKVISDGVLYFVAEADNGLAGVIGVFPERRHVYHLFVDRSHHRRGVGRRLWEFVLDAIGPGPVTVNSSRFAIGFYERLGFTSTGQLHEKDDVIAYPMRWEQDAR